VARATNWRRPGGAIGARRVKLAPQRTVTVTLPWRSSSLVSTATSKDTHFALSMSRLAAATARAVSTARAGVVCNGAALAAAAAALCTWIDIAALRPA